MADWIPANEDGFNELANKFGPAIFPNPTPWGLSAADATALDAGLTAWNSTRTTYKTAETALDAALPPKTAARETLTALMRTLAAQVQADPAVTDAMRETAGLPIRKTTHTPAAPITTKPVLAIDSSRYLEHIISWRDAETPASKARPKGASGLRLHVKIGAPAPTSIAECRPLGTINRSPNIEQFEAGDAGKMAYYIGQWENTAGEPGPTSEVSAATIGAQG